MWLKIYKLFAGEMEELYDSFLDSSSLRIKNFGEETTEDWARFVMNNRNRGFENYSDPLCNFDSKYDIVIGPVADDNMAMLFRQYEEEVIDFDTLLKGMIYKKTSSQYSFHTPAAISLLRKISYE
ncbi:Protein of unknown function [Butyrivibrio hungatei]|uniref:Uncharacterized protein n=3 Tax=Butyrivibrio hungatei TaxID=185008 RepID=A0A1G5BCG7_9FIRM|nr:Protein of unknown function [Butyrivibrio hungatei]